MRTTDLYSMFHKWGKENSLQILLLYNSNTNQVNQVLLFSQTTGEAWDTGVYTNTTQINII